MASAQTQCTGDQTGPEQEHEEAKAPATTPRTTPNATTWEDRVISFLLPCAVSPPKLFQPLLEEDIGSNSHLLKKADAGSTICGSMGSSLESHNGHGQTRAPKVSFSQGKLASPKVSCPSHLAELLFWWLPQGLAPKALSTGDIPRACQPN